jgi:hypothetical protein
VWLSCSENGAVEVETVNPESAAGHGEMVAMILGNCQKQNSIFEIPLQAPHDLRRSRNPVPSL